MFNEDHTDQRPTGDSSRSAHSQSAISSRFEQFEKRQGELWRLTLLVLFLLGLAYAWTSWDSIRSLAHRFEALPIGLVILVILFTFYTWKKTQEISELRGLMRGLEQHKVVAPSDRQLDQLFEIISRSQQGYRDLIDSFDDVLLALSLDGQIRAVNRSFSDLVATPFQQIIGRPLSEFVQDGSGEGPELVKRAMPRFLERRQWSGVVQARLKSQTSVFYFDCVAHAMMRGDQIHGVTVLARDISVLRRNEARFTELFESLQEGIYITTPEGTILDANPALVRMLGYDSKEELLKRQVPEIFVDRAERKIVKEQVERQPMMQGREITLVRRDGTSIVCLNTAGAVRDNAGRVVRYQGSLLDVTERREMERRLHQQQEFARRLVDNFPDLILVLDTAAHYTFVSPRCKEVLGYDVEELQDMEFGGRTHPEDLPAALTLYRDIVAGKQTFASLEVRVRHKQGDWRRIRFNFSPLCNEKGDIEGVVLSGRDVTDLKRLEEQLIQAEKLAAMGQMLAGVAHELNNPLTAVLGVTELLRERVGTDEATNLQLEEHSLRRNNFAVDCRGDASLPPVLGDANQLIQVFLNLVSNAEHAIREVRDSGRIHIRLARTGEKILVIVQDDGVGIRPEALPKLFDPFYTTKRPAGGTGLGLSICLSIIREHGGTIEAEVLPGGGSAFTVHFPVAQEVSMSSPLDTQVQSRESLQRAADFLKGRSVLVVDDEEGIQLLLKEGLAAHGLRVDCVSTGGQALALLGKQEYDAVLCDLNLPGSPSGREIAERIRSSATRGKPAVLLMTGDLASAAPDGSDLEPKRWLQKPFRIAEVISALAEALLSADAETIRK